MITQLTGAENNYADCTGRKDWARQLPDGVASALQYAERPSGPEDGFMVAPWDTQCWKEQLSKPDARGYCPSVKSGKQCVLILRTDV